jgi:hypothetical protein
MSDPLFHIPGFPIFAEILLMKLILLLGLCALISCSKSDVPESPSPTADRVFITKMRQVDTVTNATLRSDTFKYDAFNRLQNAASVTQDEQWSFSYLYEGNNILARRSIFTSYAPNGVLNGTLTNHLQYDAQNRLVYDSFLVAGGGSHADTSVHTYVYQGTSYIFTERSTYYGNNSDTVTQVLDQKGNIVHVEYVKNDGKKRVIDITYDNNPNPLYEISAVRSPNFQFPMDNTYGLIYPPQPNMFRSVTDRLYSTPTSFTEFRLEFTNSYNANGYPISYSTRATPSYVNKSKFYFFYRN